MAMNYTNLADEIKTEMGFSGATSTQLIGWARGVVEEIQASTATFNSGTPTHSIVSIDGDSMATLIKTYAGYGSVTDILKKYTNAMSDYIVANAVVTYTGPPPPATPDYFLGGTISGMVGSDMADAIVAAISEYPTRTDLLTKKCNAVVNHIHTNASVVSGAIS